MSEISNHKQVVSERLASQKLSTMELRQQARVRHEQLLDPASGPDREMLVAELEVIDGMIQAAIPPPPGPEELLAQLEQTDPLKASTLRHQMERQQLQDQLTEALERATAHPESTAAQERLQAAQDALTNQAPPQFIQNMQRVRELRDQAEALQGNMHLATDQEQMDEINSQTAELFKQAECLETGREYIPPGEKPPAPGDHKQPDHVTAAEAAVAAAQQAASA